MTSLFLCAQRFRIILRAYRVQCTHIRFSFLTSFCMINWVPVQCHRIAKKYWNSKTDYFINEFHQERCPEHRFQTAHVSDLHYIINCSNPSSSLRENVQRKSCTRYHETWSVTLHERTHITHCPRTREHVVSSKFRVVRSSAGILVNILRSTRCNRQQVCVLTQHTSFAL